MYNYWNNQYFYNLSINQAELLEICTISIVNI